MCSLAAAYAIALLLLALVLGSMAAAAHAAAALLMVLLVVGHIAGRYTGTSTAACELGLVAEPVLVALHSHTS